MRRIRGLLALSVGLALLAAACGGDQKHSNSALPKAAETNAAPDSGNSEILALALNYQEHIDETNLHFFNEPIVFEKYRSNLIGHDDAIVLPPFPQKVDEEHELALVGEPSEDRAEPRPDRPSRPWRPRRPT